MGKYARWMTGLSLAALLGLAACGAGGGGNGSDDSEEHPGFGSDNGSGSGADTGVPTTDGILDASFSGNGYLRVCGTAGGQHDEGISVAQDGAGRIIVVGASSKGKYRAGTALWRFASDGTAKGIVIYDFAGSRNTPEGGAVMDSVGRMLVAHHAGSRMAVARYTNGAPDKTYGGDGYSARPAVLLEDTVGGITRDRQGRAILAGGTKDSGPIPNHLVVRRFHTNGTSDASFNGKGFVVLPSPVPGVGVMGVAAAVDAEDRIVVLGVLHHYSASPHVEYDYEIVLWRFFPDGRLDPAFGTNGVVRWPTDSNSNGPISSGSAIAIDAQGRILVAGTVHFVDSPYSYINPSHALWRFTAAGAPDTTFSGDGFVESSSIDRGNAMALDTAGRIVLVGRIYLNGRHRMAVWRYTDSGTLDTSFHGSGMITKSGAAGGRVDEGTAVLIDPAGRIVVAGYALNNNEHACMALWRVMP